MWKHIRFNEILKSFGIHPPFVQVARDISMNCERWQETEVTMFLTRDLRANSLASRSPAERSFTQLGIQTRLINEDKLVGTPIAQLGIPMIMKLLVPFFRLLLELYIS
jgi:hypothetical protein